MESKNITIERAHGEQIPKQTVRIELKKFLSYENKNAVLNQYRQKQGLQ